MSADNLAGGDSELQPPVAAQRKGNAPRLKMKMKACGGGGGGGGGGG